MRRLDDREPATPKGYPGGAGVAHPGCAANLNRFVPQQQNLRWILGMKGGGDVRAKMEVLVAAMRGLG